MELDAGWCNVCHRDNSRAGGGVGAGIERTGCGHRDEVVESTISLPLHTAGTK